MTMIGATEFGRIWRNRLRIGVEPSAVEAVLNSRFFELNTAPRAIRAVETHPNNASTSTTFQIDELVRNICSTTMAPSSIGMARKMSTRRLSTASTHPPKKPAMAPMSVPTATTMIVVSTPTLIEVRAP